MDMDCDLLVIGGGMAGLVAGCIAAKEGLSTILLRKGQSATAYSSGAVDIIGYLPQISEPFSSPAEGLTVIAGLYPLHPYSIIGYSENIEPENVVREIISRTHDAITWLKTILKDSIAPLIGDFNSNIYPITVLGTTKPTCLIQKTMHSGTLQENEDSTILFTGIKGHADFNSSIAAKTYLEDRVAIGEPPRKVGQCNIQIAPFGKPFNLSSIEIARHLDHENSIEEIGKQLKKHVEQLGVTHVAIPPVLGLRKAQDNKKKLEELIDATVFELLGFPPSVPGLRLQIALEEIFRKSGGKLLVGHEAVSYTNTKGHLKNVTAKAPRREIKIDAKTFILASGKYIGGGLSGNLSGIHETVFGLMTVTGAYHSASDVLPTRMTNRVAISPVGQPVQSCGLTVDPHYRPVKEDGVEWASNLFAAGSILAGYDYSAEKSGLGVAATSGYSAAKSVIDFIKGVI